MTYPYKDQRDPHAREHDEIEGIAGFIKDVVTYTHRRYINNTDLNTFLARIEMRHRINISIIVLVLIASCSVSRSKVYSEQYTNCLPKLFEADLSKLVESFDQFVIRNHNGELDDFILEVLNRNFPEQSEFNVSDYQIAKRLRKNSFRDYIYTEYEEKFSDSGIAPPRTAGQTDEPKNKMIKVDLGKPYLKCLSSIQTNGKLIKNYVDLQNANSSLSPLVIGELFLNNKTDKDYGTKLANTIIAVELYYMILDSATKE